MRLFPRFLSLSFALLAPFSILTNPLPYPAIAASNDQKLDTPNIDLPVKPNFELAASNCGLGRVHYMEGDVLKALESFSECIKYSPPDYFEGYSYRSQTYLELVTLSKDKKEIESLKSKAIADLSYLIDHGQDNQNYYESRGYAYADLGDGQKALIDLHKANDLHQKKYGEPDSLVEFDIQELEKKGKLKFKHYE